MNDEFLKWLRDFAFVGVPSAAIAVGLFVRFLGGKWIDQRLAKNLEGFKSEQQRELERLRQFLSGRISRIHEKEFEVLPRAWLLVHKAHGALAACTSPLRSFPDFDKMPEGRFDEFLKDCRLSGAQKDELRKSSDRRKFYSDAMSWVFLGEAGSAQVELSNFLIEHRIFMTQELRDTFGTINAELANAVREYETWKHVPDERNFLRSSQERTSALDKKMVELERALQERLHYGEA